MKKKLCKEMTNRAWDVGPALVIRVTFHFAGERDETERSAFEGPKHDVLFSPEPQTKQNLLVDRLLREKSTRSTKIFHISKCLLSLARLDSCPRTSSSTGRVSSSASGWTDNDVYLWAYKGSPESSSWIRL